VRCARGGDQAGWCTRDSSQQALFVAQRVLDLREEGIELRDMQCSNRAHYHSMEVQMEFTRHGIPFQITSGLRFFEQACEGRGRFLKFGEPRDEVAFNAWRGCSRIGARARELGASQPRLESLPPPFIQQSTQQPATATSACLSRPAPACHFRSAHPAESAGESGKAWKQLGAQRWRKSPPPARRSRPEMIIASSGGL